MEMSLRWFITLARHSKLSALYSEGVHYLEHTTKILQTFSYLSDFIEKKILCGKQIKHQNFNRGLINLNFFFLQGILIIRTKIFFDYQPKLITLPMNLDF